MSSLDNIPIPEPEVVGSIVESGEPGKTEAVLVLPDKGKLKVLNEVGARIWALADGKRSISEIAVVICTEYAVSQQQAESDVLNFVDSLVQKGIFRLTEKPAA